MSSIIHIYRVNGEGVVLVGDFGLARDVYAADYYRSSANSRLPVKWMPPETLNDGISNEKTDVVYKPCMGRSYPYNYYTKSVHFQSYVESSETIVEVLILAWVRL